MLIPFSLWLVSRLTGPHLHPILPFTGYSPYPFLLWPGLLRISSPFDRASSPSHLHLTWPSLHPISFYPNFSVSYLPLTRELLFPSLSYLSTSKMKWRGDSSETPSSICSQPCALGKIRNFQVSGSILVVLLWAADNRPLGQSAV